MALQASTFAVKKHPATEYVFDGHLNQDLEDLVDGQRVGAEGCDYQIRAQQSAGVLHQVIVVKDPNTGQLMVRENEVCGPMAYIETTISLRLNPQNIWETRSPGREMPEKVANTGPL